METEAKTEPMDHPADDQLGFCILAADRGHVAAALLRSVDVWHGSNVTMATHGEEEAKRIARKHGRGVWSDDGREVAPTARPG